MWRRSTRTPRIPPPSELGERDGLAYALYLPDGPPRGGIVILHGADSCKERHFDFARAARADGFAAVAFDQRGHGASSGPLGAGAIDDVAEMAALLPPAPLALRGSSMGGYLALVAAAQLGAAAVVAICPASGRGLGRGLRGGRFDFAADVPALERFLETHDELEAVAALRAPLLLLHAEGDESVPVEHSRELLEASGSPTKRLVAVPGGTHHSAQHDPELQALSLRFLARALEATASGP